ncbi:RimK family protein [Celerinatantimonas sp. YJH-8]|uniref:RimK family protein n=1 Tax=Celerinatantimonas sp. YJH-8 TaxID=3228714 RepID=UPI0038C2591D
MYKTLVVVDNVDSFPDVTDMTVISFADYVADYPKLNEPRVRIINLCDTSRYLSRGYYCSLLAEARQHKILPTVKTINQVRNLSKHLTEAAPIQLTDELSQYVHDQSCVDLISYFGWTSDPRWRTLASELFRNYPAPLLHLQISASAKGLKLQVERMSYIQLDAPQQTVFMERLQRFAEHVWRVKTLERRYRWSMALLVDPEELLPPSDQDAMKRFIKAARKLGIEASRITAQDHVQLNQFDALFIRQTTAIDHPTYRLACEAEQQGLVVIDDPTSILRCCNKVFLHDAFTYNQVPSLKTRVVMSCDDAQLDQLESEFSYPMVIKKPEGSFSDGVFKVSTRDELQKRLSQMLEISALMLVQEYLYTEFDWRIGLLNGKPIFACRYYMARNHWQIYNHASKRFSSGGWDSLPTFEVPRVVLEAAIRAGKMIGNGLYGVDLKQQGHKAYVIEVNDNPSIDHKVEDGYLGDELYMVIMREFVDRLERRGRS